MKRIVLVASLGSVLSLGCSAQPRMARVAAETAREPVAEPAAITAEKVIAPDMDPLAIGDSVTFRFSGAYRSEPLTVTQRVVGRERGMLLIDMTLEDGMTERNLRLRVGDEPENQGQLLSVARLEGGVQKPFGIAAYEALMQSTMLEADENLAMIGSTGEIVPLGNADVVATKTSYRVRVGAELATMSTWNDGVFAWGDLGGEIVADDGTVLYRAEVVAAGNDAIADPFMATHDELEPYGESDDPYED